MHANALYTVSAQSLLYSNSRDVWEQHSVCWEKAGGWQWGLLCLVPQQTHLSASVLFSWGSPQMASSLRYAASQVQKHNETHASRKTHKKKCRCYIIKDALCWFRLGEACGQEMDTWTFCGCFSEWSEVKHSYGWKTSVIWCQRFPDTWQKELWSHNKQFPSMHDCLKCIFGHVRM